MLILLRNQGIEFVGEIIVFVLIFVPMGMFFSPAPQSAMSGIIFSINLWSVWVLYRAIFLQIPLVMYAKFLLARRIRLATWMSAVVNVVSTGISFVMFGIFFGNALVFFEGQNATIPAVFFLAGIISPYFLKFFFERDKVPRLQGNAAAD